MTNRDLLTFKFGKTAVDAAYKYADEHFGSLDEKIIDLSAVSFLAGSFGMASAILEKLGVR